MAHHRYWGPVRPQPLADGEPEGIMAGFDFGCDRPSCRERYGAGLDQRPHGHVAVDCDDGAVVIPVPFQSLDGLRRLLDLLKRDPGSIFAEPGVCETILSQEMAARLPHDVDEAEAGRLAEAESAGIRYAFVGFGR